MGNRCTPGARPLAVAVAVLVVAHVVLPVYSGRVLANKSGKPSKASPSPPPPPPAGPSPCGDGQVPWSGLCWFRRSATGGPCGSGCSNTFVPENAWVDAADVLHLQIKSARKRWTCGEVYLNQSLGYGTYTWTIGSNPSTVDENVVPAAFLYASDTQEYDFEFTTWGQGGTPNAQMVVQPPFADTGYNATIKRSYAIDAATSTHQVVWSADTVTFSSAWTGGSQTFSYTGDKVSSWVPGGERVHLNHWMYLGKAPTSAQDFQVKCFQFCPAGGGACVGKAC